MRTKRLLLSSVLLAACGASASGRCRMSAAFQQNPYLREMQLNRCQEIENLEYLEHARQDEHRREDDREQVRQATELERARGAADRESQESRRAVRSAPRSPELGATPAESDALCARQGGHQTTETRGDGVLFVCGVGATPIYTAHLPPGSEVFDAVMTLYEGADIAQMRTILEQKLGAADFVAVEGGFRVWRWERITPRTKLATYAGGVSLTVSVVGPTQTTSAGEGAPN